MSGYSLRPWCWPPIAPLKWGDAPDRSADWRDIARDLAAACPVVDGVPRLDVNRATDVAMRARKLLEEQT